MDPVRPTLRRRLAAAVRAFTHPDDRHAPSAAQEAERLANYPPPYPRGWYRVADSADLRPGAVRRVGCLGRELVVFRTAAGRVSVLDGHCVHQGAHLAFGGEVDGDCLKCPFHHWRFDADGHVVHIPNADKLPRARIRPHPTREVDGMVWMFWDPKGEIGAPPQYEPEVQDDIAAGKLVFRGSHDHGDVRMHLVEFAENSVDFQHFEPVHGAMRVPWTNLTLPLVRIHHEARWEVDAERPWVTTFHNEPHLLWRNKKIPGTGLTARITLYGPGGITTFRFSLPKLGDILMYHLHTPVAPSRQRVVFRWFADTRIPRPLVSYVVGNWIAQWKGDIDIWENKIYRTKPILSRADGPVHAMRRWYRQFYDDPLPGGASVSAVG